MGSTVPASSCSTWCLGLHCRLSAHPVQLRGVYLGHSAPRVTSVKVVPPADGGAPGGSFGVREELSLDCSFSWSSRMEVKLLCSLLPEQQAQLQRGRGLLRQVRAAG